MGIVLAKKDFKKYITTANKATDIQNTYGVEMNLENNKPLVFRFFAGWSQSEKMFTTVDGFASYLALQTNLWDKGIIVK